MLFGDVLAFVDFCVTLSQEPAMASKLPEDPNQPKPPASAFKRRRQTLTIAQKVTLLEMLEEGRSYASVGRHFGINESTVRSIKKNEKKIRSSATVTFNNTAKRLITTRNMDIVRMESALAVWITNCMTNNIPLDSVKIRLKAKQMYETMCVDDPENVQPRTSHDTSTRPAEFNASKGWYERFQRRYNLKTDSLHRKPSAVNSSDPDEYVQQIFRAFLMEGWYCHEQVFNMSDTLFFWKRIPSSAFVRKDGATEFGFEAYTKRVKLLLCGNAAGFMIQPALVHKSSDPSVLKNKKKDLLPVHWMHHPKLCLTAELLSDWFYKCFIPQVKLYLAEKELEFKVLLLMNSAEDLSFNLSYEGVKIQFLPPNPLSLIQPMDQGIIRTFKALYTRNVLLYLVEALDTDDSVSLHEHWYSYNIMTCLQNIHNTIKEMEPETLSACWTKLWPEAIYHCKGSSPNETQSAAIYETLKLAKLLGGDEFADITSEDVNNLIDCLSDSFTDENLVEMTDSANETVELEEDLSEGVGLTLERLSSLMRAGRELQRMVEEWDPQMMRALQFRNTIERAMDVYKSILAQKYSLNCVSVAY